MDKLLPIKDSLDLDGPDDIKWLYEWSKTADKKIIEQEAQIASLKSTVGKITEQRDQAWLVAEHREANVQYEDKLRQALKEALRHVECTDGRRGCLAGLVVNTFSYDQWQALARVKQMSVYNELSEADKLIQTLTREKTELLADYARVVEKFDKCRGILAAILAGFGEDPNSPSPGEEWHEWMIDRIFTHMSKIDEVAEPESLRSCLEKDCPTPDVDCVDCDRIDR